MWLALLPIVLTLGLLALLFALSRCGRDEAAVAPVVTNETDATVTNTTTTTTTTNTGSVNLPGGTVLAVTPGGLNEQVAGFLAGTEATPRTFEFDTMHFATASSELTASDKTTVDDVASSLAALHRFGYDIADPRAAVRAFQRRFRPSRLDGVFDAETRSILLGLLT